MRGSGSGAPDADFMSASGWPGGILAKQGPAPPRVFFSYSENAEFKFYQFFP